MVPPSSKLHCARAPLAIPIEHTAITSALHPKRPIMVTLQAPVVPIMNSRSAKGNLRPAERRFAREEGANHVTTLGNVTTSPQ